MRTSSKLGLAAAGVVIFAGAVVAGLAFDEYVEAGAPAATDRAAVALIADGTEMLGTWEITYPKVLRANQDGALAIRYRSDRPWLLEQVRSRQLRVRSGESEGRRRRVARLDRDAARGG